MLELLYILLIFAPGVLLPLLSTKKDDTSTYTQAIVCVAVIIGGAIGMLTYFHQAGVDMVWRVIGIVSYGLVIIVTFLTIRKRLRKREYDNYPVNIGTEDNKQYDPPRPRRWYHCKGYH